jgi:phosphatidylglycerophosphatase A
MKRVALLLATVAGAGYVPRAPGTVGSAAGVLVYFVIAQWRGAWQLALLGAVVAAGTWAATVAARHFNREDPGHVVIDEVAGQLVTLLFTGVGWGGALIGFLLFRVLDVVKPWPARQLEALPQGYGIMADDLMAGLYGGLMLRLLLWGVPGIR